MHETEAKKQKQKTTARSRILKISLTAVFVTTLATRPSAQASPSYAVEDHVGGAWMLALANRDAAPAQAQGEEKPETAEADVNKPQVTQLQQRDAGSELCGEC